jgi:hypothetical protein
MGVKSLAIGGKKALVTRGGKLVNTGRVVVVSPCTVVEVEVDEVDDGGFVVVVDLMVVVVEELVVVGGAVTSNFTVVVDGCSPQKSHAQIS